jgi:hypothetical protein
MKKVAFAFGYAGGILALLFSLLMIFTVSAGLITKAVDDIKYDMKNENVIAFNEIALAMREQGVTDLSEGNIEDFARGVAKGNKILSDENVYTDTVAFTYKIAVHGIISVILVGVSILFALLAFIGALVMRKAPLGGGILMIISALVLLLSAIYTETVIPMIAASVLLAAAGIIALAPEQQKAYAHARHARVKAVPSAAPPIPQPPFIPLQYQAYPPAVSQYPEPPQPPFVQSMPAVPEPAEAAPPELNKTDVPFPEEEVQLFPPHADEGEQTKE